MDGWFSKTAEELKLAAAAKAEELAQAANVNLEEVAKAAQKTVTELQEGAAHLAALRDEFDDYWTPPEGTKVLEFGKGSLGFKLEGTCVVGVQKDSQAERLGVVAGDRLAAVAGYKVPTFSADDVEGEQRARDMIDATMREVGRPISLTFIPLEADDQGEEGGEVQAPPNDEEAPPADHQAQQQVPVAPAATTGGEAVDDAAAGFRGEAPAEDDWMNLPDSGTEARAFVATTTPDMTRGDPPDAVPDDVDAIPAVAAVSSSATPASAAPAPADAGTQSVVKALTANAAKLKDRVARQAKEIEELTAKLAAVEAKAASDVAALEERATTAEETAARLAEELRGIGDAHEAELDLHSQEHRLHMRDLQMRVETLSEQLQKQRADATSEAERLKEAVQQEQVLAREAMQKAADSAKAAALELEAAAVEAAEARRLQAEAADVKAQVENEKQEDRQGLGRGGSSLSNIWDDSEAPQQSPAAGSLEVARLYERIDDLEARCNGLQAKLKARPVILSRGAGGIDDSDSGAGAGHGHPFWLPLVMRFAGPKLLQCLVITHTVIDRVLRNFTFKMLQREWLLWSFYAHLAVVYWMLSYYLMTEAPPTPAQQLENAMAHSVSASSRIAASSSPAVVSKADLPPSVGLGAVPQQDPATTVAAAVGHLATTPSPMAEASSLRSRRRRPPRVEQQEAVEEATPEESREESAAAAGAADAPDETSDKAEDPEAAEPAAAAEEVEGAVEEAAPAEEAAPQDDADNEAANEEDTEPVAEG